jgi:transcriptional regulator with XRE-family HTH domain
MEKFLPDAAKSLASKQSLSVAESLRYRRKQLGLTLEEVAAKSGLSAAFISQAERRKAVPSIVSLINLSKALDVPIQYFLTAPSLGKLIHRADAPEYYPIDSPVTYIRLSAGHRGQQMDAFIFEIPPGPTFPRVHRDGESFYYMLEGHLFFSVDSETHEWGPGDSLHFNSQHSYTMQNRGERLAKVLWVGTPPLFPTDEEASAATAAP